MQRSRWFGLLVACCSAALPMAAPAAPLDVAEGYKPAAAAIAAAPDGGTFVVLQSRDRDASLGNTDRRPPRLEFFRLHSDGTAAAHTVLPEQEEVSSEFAPRVAVLSGGDLAVFVAFAPRDAGRRTLAHLLRLSPEGTLRHSADIGHPNYASAAWRTGPDGMLYANALVAGPRDTVIAGGGCYGGPYIPWWGHFTADGVKLAEGDDLNMTPGPGVTDAAFAADGRFRLLGSHFNGLGKFDATLALYAADGKIEARHTLLAQGGEVGWSLFTAHGIVFIGDSRKDDSAVRFYDRDGKQLSSTPWPEQYVPTGLIADGDGVAGLVGDWSDKPQQILRVDGTGKIVWRSAPDDYLALMRGADGALRALVTRHDANNNYAVELVNVGKP